MKELYWQYVQACWLNSQTPLEYEVWLRAYLDRAIVVNYLR